MRVLIHYRGEPGCASFDKYIEVPEGSPEVDIYQAAFDLFSQLEEAQYKPPNQSHDICTIDKYDISIGPSFAEL